MEVEILYNEILSESHGPGQSNTFLVWGSNFSSRCGTIHKYILWLKVSSFGSPNSLVPCLTSSTLESPPKNCHGENRLDPWTVVFSRSPL